MPAEFVIGEHTYRITRLNAMQQFHIARRLAPLIAKIGPAFREAVGATLEELTEKLAPIIEALASMPDDDCNYVIERCMASTQRQQGPVWATVWNLAAKRFQFEDIDLRVLLELTAYALRENLSDFFKGLPADGSAQATEESASSVSAPARTGFLGQS